MTSKVHPEENGAGDNGSDSARQPEDQSESRISDSALAGSRFASVVGKARYRISQTSGSKNKQISGSPIIGPQGIDQLVIHPQNRCQGVFDLLVAIAVFYTAITMPVKVAFNTDFMTELDILVNVLFWADIVLQFFQGYLELGFPVLDLHRVAHRYLTTWLPLDLLASLPYEAMSGDSRFRAFQLIKTVRLLRISRLMRTWGFVAGANLLRVVFILVGWIMVAHWYACAFYSLGWVPRCTSEIDTWLTVYWEEIPPVDICGESFSVGDGVGGEDIVAIPRRYVRSLYWALATMSSMGYGSAPVAHTDGEYIFAIWCQVTGACLYAMIFGNIAQVIAKVDASGIRYQAQLDKINEFIRFHSCPAHLRKKLRAYNDFHFAVNSGFDLQQITSALPPNLQQEVFLHVHEDLIRQVPMFENCSDELVKSLVQVLEPQVLLRGDCAFIASELGRSMYFIQKGFVQITGDAKEGQGDIVYCTLLAGSFFGEIAMFTSQRRTATARAATDCILFHMTNTDFEHVIRDYPKYYDDILEKAMERLEMIVRSNASHEVRMKQIELRADILRERNLKKLGVQGDQSTLLQGAALALHKKRQSLCSNILERDVPQNRHRMSAPEVQGHRTRLVPTPDEPADPTPSSTDTPEAGHASLGDSGRASSRSAYSVGMSLCKRLGSEKKLVASEKEKKLTVKRTSTHWNLGEREGQEEGEEGNAPQVHGTLTAANLGSRNDGGGEEGTAGARAEKCRRVSTDSVVSDVGEVDEFVVKDVIIGSSIGSKKKSTAERYAATGGAVGDDTGDDDATEAAPDDATAIAAGDGNAKGSSAPGLDAGGHPPHRDEGTPMLHDASVKLRRASHQLPQLACRFATSARMAAARRGSLQHRRRVSLLVEDGGSSFGGRRGSTGFDPRRRGSAMCDQRRLSDMSANAHDKDPVGFAYAMMAAGGPQREGRSPGQQLVREPRVPRESLMDILETDTAPEPAPADQPEPPTDGAAWASVFSQATVAMQELKQQMSQLTQKMDRLEGRLPEDVAEKVKANGSLEEGPAENRAALELP